MFASGSGWFIGFGFGWGHEAGFQPEDGAIVGDGEVEAGDGFGHSGAGFLDEAPAFDLIFEAIVAASDPGSLAGGDFEGDGGGDIEAAEVDVGGEGGLIEQFLESKGGLDGAGAHGIAWAEVGAADAAEDGEVLESLGVGGGWAC